MRFEQVQNFHLAGTPYIASVGAPWHAKLWSLRPLLPVCGVPTLALLELCYTVWICGFKVLRRCGWRQLSPLAEDKFTNWWL
jgi:hypothetical protein